MALFGFVREKARRISSAVGNPEKGLLKWFVGGAVRGANYSEIMSAEQALSHPIVYRCVHKIASAVQGVTWYVEPTDEKGVAKPTAAQMKAIQAVLDSPHWDMDSDQFKYWLAMNKALLGRFAFKVGVDKNVPSALYPLQPAYLFTEITRAGAVKTYRYGQAESYEYMPPRSTVDPAGLGNFKDSFAFEYVTPTLTGSQLLLGPKNKNNSPLNSIGLPSEIIKMLLQRAHDTASGHPNIKYIVSAEKTLSSDQEDELKDEFDEREVGAEKSGNILLITNTTVKIDKLDNGLEDIHTKLPMDDMTRMIYSSFGIPIALAGIGSSDAAKFAGNFDASRRSFYEDTIIPTYCEPIAKGLTAAFCPPGARVRFDYDTIPAIADLRAKKARDLQNITFLDDDEKRELCGFRPRVKEGKTNDPAS